jgi:formate C-acetyltransferase
MSSTIVGVTPRIEMMQQNMPNKNYRAVLRGLEKEEKVVVGAYRQGVKICLERARFYTESYKETEGKPTVLRRAQALANILRKMTVYISEGERVVGNYASSPYHLTFHPEYYSRWVEKAVNDGYRDLLDDESRKELSGIIEYWRDKSIQGRERFFLPKDVEPYWRYSGAIFWGHFAESGIPNYEKIFRIGLNGLIEEAKRKREQIDNDENLTVKEYLEIRNTLDAMIISLQAAIDWGKRYAEKANELAKEERDGQRKKELEEIAEICEWVPGNPPRTFHEALQSFYFIHTITHLIEAYENGVGVRFDQLFYPLYQKDKEEGRITVEEATELLQMLWLKMEEMSILFAPVLGGGVQGSNLFQTFTIGGVDPEGKDASNELSHIIIDSVRPMKTSQPTLAVRIHHHTPQDFLFHVVELIGDKWGDTSLFNDEYLVPALLGLGIPVEDARNYGIEQCMRWTIPGKNIVYRALEGMLILPKFLELALNKGIDRLTGKQLGAVTPDPSSFESIEDIKDAFLTQVRFFAEKLAVISRTTDALYEEYLPRPFLSALFDEGIKRGIDCRKWCYYPKRVIGPLGAINVANSLAAIKKLVFEDKKKMSMAELLEALDKNFEGKEELRQMLLDAPKYGNDDDYVDVIAAEVQSKVSSEVEKLHNIYGHKYIMDGSSGSAYYAYSGLTAATPDGRKAKETFADGTASPVIGTDKKGPTAVLKSVAKTDPLTSYNHLLNQKFLPQFLSGENKELFAAYLRTWCDLGIHHIQFNVVDREALLDAKEHPENYSNLVVRVAGYAAYFVDLSPNIQDEVIRRTEQEF